MTRTDRVLKNTGILMGMELGTRLMDAVVSILLIRYLGPMDFGLMAFALSFAYLFSILPGFGMGAMTTRDVAQDRERIGRYVSNGLAAKVLLAGLTYAVVAVTARVMGFPADKGAAVMLAGGLMIIETNVRYLVSFFQGTQRMGTVATVNLSIRAGWIAGSLLIMLLGGNVTHLLGVRVAVTALGLLVVLWFIHASLQRIVWKFEPRFMLHLMKMSLPFAMFRLRGQLYMDIDTVMVSALRGDVMCGWYAVAQKSLRILSFIPSSFSNALLPAMSNARQERGPQAVAEALGRNCRYLAVLGFAIAGGIFIVSSWMVPFFYGEAFRQAVPAQQVLIWAVPFAFLNGSLIAATAAINRESQASWCLVGGALFSGLSNFIVVPLWGHIGAAATTTLAEMVICYTQLRLVQGVVPGFALLQGRGWGLGLALSGLLGAGLLLHGFPVAVRLTAALGLYAWLIHLTGVLSAADRKAFGKIFRRREGVEDAEKMTTILFLETSLRVGGTETVITRLMNGLDRERFRPVLCCLYEPGVLGERLIRAGHPVHSRLGSGRWDPRVGLRLLRILREERVDALFIVNQPLTQFWGILCGVLAGVRVRVMAVRSTGKIHRVRRRLWINRWTLPWVTRVTALSAMHKSYLSEREGIPPEKMEIIPNGVDLSRFQLNGELKGLRGKLEIPEDAPLVGIVAMLRPEKNHALFLEAAQRVLRRVPGAHFVVVGDGPEWPALEAMARTAGIRERVSFLGVREDVPAVVSLFDVAVLCSHPVVETMSNAVLEYMAAARPVVATRVGSLPEQIEEGRTGFLVEPGDAETLADRIVRLLEDPGLRAKMGEAGRRRVEERFSLERMVSETGGLFERLVAAERGA